VICKLQLKVSFEIDRTKKGHTFETNHGDGIDSKCPLSTFGVHSEGLSRLHSIDEQVGLYYCLSLKQEITKLASTA
jgi:hypothetical protein